MKCVTLHQPWASLIALKLKRIETRGWKTNYRGELYIHAGKKMIPFEELFEELTSEQREEIMGIIIKEYGGYDKLPTGQIIAKTNLTDCIPTENIKHITETEKAFGDFTPGRYGWILQDIEKIDPIPAKGKQGFWHYRGGSKQ